MSFFENIYNKFESLSLFSYDFLHLLGLVIFLFILNEVIRFLYSFYKLQIKIIYGYYGFISKEYIMKNFSDKSFEKWCTYLCENMGLINVKKNHDFNPSSPNIKGFYHKKSVHISTILFEHDEDYYEFNDILPSEPNIIVDTDVVRSFVGSLIADNISHGMIFTNGYFSDECKSYVNSLSSVSVELIDGDMLISKYLEYISKRNKKSTKKINSNSSIYIEE